MYWVLEIGDEKRGERKLLRGEWSNVEGERTINAST